VNGELLERQYRNHLSGYMSWNQLSHAEEWVLFEKNIGPYVGIDEVSLSQGELYTILINKEKRGRSGSIIAIIKGTDVRTVTSVLLKLSRRRRFQVREITLDMAPNMEQTARICFPAVESKGFYEPVVVQDFPIRGKKLFLNIRRRRWIVKDEGRYVSRNWKLVAEGSRMTHDFASFLKELY
jgi:transposase